MHTNPNDNNEPKVDTSTHDHTAHTDTSHMLNNLYLTLGFFIPTIFTISTISTFTIPLSFMTDNISNLVLLLPLSSVVSTIIATIIYRKISIKFPNENNNGNNNGNNNENNINWYSPLTSLLISLAPLLLVFIIAFTDTLF